MIRMSDLAKEIIDMSIAFCAITGLILCGSCETVKSVKPAKMEVKTGNGTPFQPSQGDAR